MVLRQISFTGTIQVKACILYSFVGKLFREDSRLVLIHVCFNGYFDNSHRINLILSWTNFSHLPSKKFF